MIPNGVLDMFDDAIADERDIEPDIFALPIIMFGQCQIGSLQQPGLLAG
jgi:hypothetical protein